MTHAVIDTNVLVSGLISPNGNEALLILAINQGLVTPCFSREILEEYSAVLLRPKFGFTSREVEALLELFQRQGRLVDPAPMPPRSIDPEDDKFIACALASKADLLITGNKRHFPQEHMDATKVVNAAEFLEIVTLEF